MIMKIIKKEGKKKNDRVNVNTRIYLRETSNHFILNAALVSAASDPEVSIISPCGSPTL
jgi:hypothetical protein